MPALAQNLVVTINGRQCEFQHGMTVLAAMRFAGIDVPHVCHDDRLQPIGACRLCSVRIDGQPHPVTACTTPLMAGAVIETHTPELESLRRTNLSLMVRRYPTNVLAAEPDHAFHKLLRQYNVTPPSQRQPSTDQREPSMVAAPPPIPSPPSSVVPSPPSSGERVRVRGEEVRREETLERRPAHIPHNSRPYHDASHPYLGLAMERCIHCYRCVRICQEVQGADVWQVWGRGPETRVAPRGELSLLAAGCVSCGACSDTCPTGAIFDQREEPAERWTTSTCVYCGVGCQLRVGTAHNKVVAIRPVPAAVNHGHLCVKGRYAFDFNHASDRVTTPLIRRDGKWHTVSWDEALDETARRLEAIINRRDSGYGPSAVGMLGSARATNEENYYAQKFARVALRTNNVDCCARVCHQPSAAALKMMLGTGAATNSFDDIEQASTIMVVGSNPTENHPIVGARIRQAVRRGTRLIVIDPRETELAQVADVHLRLHPGGNVLLLNALAAVVVDEDLVDETFMAARVDGYNAFAKFVAEYAPEAVAQRCGVSPEMIRKAARFYAAEKPAMCLHGLGMTEHLQGTEGVMALVNLALLTGNIGRPGSGVNPLRGQNNVQGAAHMGCEPSTLTGGQSLSAAQARFAHVWGTGLPTEPGMTLLQMMDAAVEGRFKALWAFGYDVYPTLAQESATAAALAKLELVIVQDLFLNATAHHFGHIFLPAASVFEKDGTFMNSDRRVQRVRAALSPPVQARPDHWIIAQVASRMGFGERFAHNGAEAIWNEIRAVWPGGAGLSYWRLGTNPPQWPCPDESHPGTPVLHGTQFAHAERTALRLVPYVPSPETIDDAFPLRLITGRHLYQFNAGTMTQRTPNALLQSYDVLEINPADADPLQVTHGDWVRMESHYGRIELPVRVTTRVRPGEVFTSFHHPDLFVNRVTSPVRDRVVHAPEYKLTAVRLEPVDTSRRRAQPHAVV